MFKIYFQFFKKESLLKSFFFFSLFLQTSSFSLEQNDYEWVGKKIWNNECNGKIEGLCSWNHGEEFASMGIGHFIWYPSKKGIYKEQFPLLLEFLEKNNITLPIWLQKDKECPWENREEFMNAQNTYKMKELRNLLSETISMQTQFIINQMENLIKSNLSSGILEKFNLIKSNSKGFFALVDYLNFKGLGNSLLEQYNHQGWGLLQVLEHMPEESQNHLEDFISTAKYILMRRVHNSPLDRKEERWLKGWFNRLDSYR